MLFVTPGKMKNLPYERMFPYDMNDLMLIASENLAFVLKDITNDNGVKLSVKHIMETDKTTFGNADFSQRVEDFSSIIFSKIERFFITKKDKYMFFDEVEQAKLLEICNSYALTAKVEVYRIYENKFYPVDFQQISLMDFMKINQAIKTLGAVFVVRPDAYIEMVGKCKEYDKTHTKHKVPMTFDKRLRAILKKYPELSTLATKKDFAHYYRQTSKIMHPDLRPNDPNAQDNFQEWQEDVNYLKTTKWYKGLR